MRATTFSAPRALRIRDNLFNNTTTMKILVINAGSSSLKYRLFDMDKQIVLCAGMVERIGEAMGLLVHKIRPDRSGEERFRVEETFPTHKEALAEAVNFITDERIGVIREASEIAAIGHRVVQGGELFKVPCLVTEEVKAGIRSLIPLAPLHNAGHLIGIETAQDLFPNAPSIVVFDTEFHQTMPPKAFMYGLPYYMYEQLFVRRYGFHGTSHKYVTRRAAEFLERPIEELNFISCHLGSGSSITAVRNGKSVDTSMGMTPLAGLIMGTRCGDIDPAIMEYLVANTGMTAKEVDKILNKESGLKGICGTNDVRDILEMREQHNPLGELAFDMLVYSIKKYIGAYYAILERVDGLIFTAGIGENCAVLRAEVCQGLEHMGMILDPEANAGWGNDVRLISSVNSSVPVFVVHTNEELEIALATERVLSAKGSIGQNI